LKRLWFIFGLIFCLTAAALPLWAGETGAAAPLAPAAVKEISIPKLYERVKEARQTLLENRLEVVRQANEAKLRLETLLGDTGRQDNLQRPEPETLKKDLEAVKEAQKVLMTMLSDILNTAMQGEAEKTAAGEGKPKALGAVSPEEALPSREYLESLIVLYEEKNAQLLKVIDSLSGIVSTGATQG
jgi:hypothetical protein